MVLILVIGMMIALGLVYRFNTAFKKYTIDMYGTYYRCLLETGELPGVGSVCKDKKMRYEIAGGSSLVGSGASGGGTTGGSSPNTNSGGGGSGSGSGKGGGSSGKTSGSGSGDGSGGGSTADSGPEAVGNGSSSKSGGRGASVIGRLRGMQNKKASTAVGTTGADKEAGAGGLPPVLAVGRARGSDDNLRGARTKMNFEMEGSGFARSETAGVTPTTATAKAPGKKGESGDSLRPRKAVEKGRAVAGKLDVDKGGGLEFGKLFRLFLIFGIVIAIVVFLGGQVLQISKGGEK